MHQCLMITEVVRAIADELRLERFRNGTLLHMALACKAFFEPAMDALWRSLLDPECIITTLPNYTRGTGDHELVSPQ